MAVDSAIHLPLPAPGAPIFVLSGGTGATGDLLARTVLAQFRVQAPIVIIGNVISEEDVVAAVDRAASAHGCIVHTMVNTRLRELLAQCAAERGVVSFDLAGPLIQHLSTELDQQPLGVPGLYRQQQIAYFRRVEAIEFTVAHDDGKRSEDLPKADIVLLGPSRCGKTPLSMYLSMIGWKVANIPIVPFVEPPAELARVDRRRVVALLIAPAQLLAHRKWRQQRLGTDEGIYTNRASVIEELREYNHYVFSHGYATVDVTDKPIESSGDEVIAVIASQVSLPQHEEAGA